MKVTLSAVATVASNNSPLAVVVKFPVPGAVLVLVPVAVASREFDVATPEYSEMAKRSGPETDMVTVIVFAPPLMFSA